ncbi:SGS3-like protein [Hibiscus syriacus]|uniref:SGS3-like protein n=1 Tax=Hibiscus syriacus TaxID=106335 RepID=A0A6A2ZWA2_HIBSY|nr:protein SUPPRESSOR OF GENE SILENCING 3-like [Hibiscus syriacus]XP_039009497.1 protein SUPPRESSOR OF GENE SILENCING 3-like [Hibiscus syriacus]KAE8696264.1 SGS3-like protein [Hibiscus syriacus]
MSSRKGNGNPSSKGKDVSGFSGSKFEQLSQGVEDMNLGLPQDDGDWEVIKRKSKIKAGTSAARPRGTQNSNSNLRGGMWTNAGSGRASGNAWATHKTDSWTATGRGNARPQTFNKTSENNNVPPNGPNPVIRPSPQYGWNRQSRAGSSPSEGSQDGSGKNNVSAEVEEDNDIDDDSDDNAIDDSDDELLTDDFDSDSSQKSHDTRKNNRWFKKFFSSLDALTIEEISDPARQWHCPACQGGPGAIDWYRGLQPLLTHAKTKGAKRVKLHRELAELLDEELSRKGTSVVPAGEAFGKWKGLKDEEKDHEIVWPPMVIIMNTRLEQDENDKWIGMGNQELLDYFSSYAAVRARHSYGPQGHRGMSVLIFESTARGYLEAERLHKHFDEQGTHREAWDRRRVLFYPGGKRQLYGYIATKEDLDSFNQHSQGKSRLKFEMRSYQEMVVNQIRQMSEDNQQLTFYKNKVAKEQRLKNALEESFGIVTEKLRKTMEENRIVRQRTKMQHEQNKEEMDFQEQFFQEQIKIIHEARDEREERFEKLQQQQRENVKLSNRNPSNTEEYKRRVDEIAKFIKFQDDEMQAFVGERDKLIKTHEEKMAAMRQRHWQEEVELEKEFDSELSQLMEKYTPDG